MRPDWDQYFINIAKQVQKRSTCMRRQVGCVIVDDKHHIISTGYNGVAPHREHCNHMKVNSLDIATYPYACEGSNSSSGTDLDRCEAIHAEQNALLQCSDVDNIYAIYVTSFPCITCAKLITSTSCEKLIYLSNYCQMDKSSKFIEKAAIEISQIKQ